MMDVVCQSCGKSVAAMDGCRCLSNKQVRATLAFDTETRNGFTIPTVNPSWTELFDRLDKIEASINEIKKMLEEK